MSFTPFDQDPDDYAAYGLDPHDVERRAAAFTDWAEQLRSETSGARI